MAEAGSSEREEKLRLEVVTMRIRLEESDRRQVSWSYLLILSCHW